jgi:hypothetical protein
MVKVPAAVNPPRPSTIENTSGSSGASSSTGTNAAAPAHASHSVTSTGVLKNHG